MGLECRRQRLRRVGCFLGLSFFRTKIKHQVLSRGAVYDLGSRKIVGARIECRQKKNKKKKKVTQIVSRRRKKKVRTSDRVP